MKVSKIILIVVALHVLVIGGIFFFEGCSRASKSTPDLAANGSQPGEPLSPPALTPPTPEALPPVAMTPPPPPAPVTPVSPVAAAPRTYVVKKGDTLTKIAKAEGITISELSKANKLTKTSVLKIGQKLQIPGKVETPALAAAAVPSLPVTASAAVTTPSVPAPAAVEGATYTVKSGDSLWKIAKENNTTVAALKQANNLQRDALKIGQKLILPTSAPVTMAAATVPVTPAAITTTSGGTVSTATTPVSKELMTPGTYQENGQTVHIVDINETPSLIAKKYGIKTDDLLRANNISDPRKVLFGQRLVIPLGSPAIPAATTPAATPAAATSASLPVVTTASIQTPVAAPIVAANPATAR